MNTRFVIVVGLLLSGTQAAGPVTGQSPASAPPASDTVAPDIPGVVLGGTRVLVIREGFQGTEGPIAGPDGSLLFTETAASRITKIDSNQVVSTFLEHSNGSNALAFDATGRLISVQTTPGKAQIGIIHPPGEAAVLATGFEGRPNDLVVAKDGGVYFTVPGPFPAAGGGAPARTTPFVPLVYYIPPGGTFVTAAQGIENPNGIQLSPDERTLYVNNTRGEYLLAFDVQPDGRLTNRRNFAKYDGVTKTATGVSSGADGLAIDSEGRVYAATTAGVQVFSPEGTHLGTIPVSRPPQNLAFAGPDKQTLYLVGRGAAYRLRMLSRGLAGRAK